MLKGLVVGILLTLLLMAGGVYLYFATGHAPVATSAPDMPFERFFARKALHAYLDKLPHLDPAVPADEKDFLEGAKVYADNCAVCHGLPDQQKTAIADGMYPQPPQLFHGTGVTDDDTWETYWKAENGIRMTGMPGFRGRLTETQIWQVSVLLKNADKISPAVKSELVTGMPPMPAPADAKPEGTAAPAKPKS
jgi:thiosulfate dehydrogenase